MRTVEQRRLEMFSRAAAFARRHSLVHIARSIAAEVTPNEAAFIDHHMPKTFLADLDAAIVRFAAAVDGRHTARRRRAELRVAVRDALAGATDTMHAIDAVVRNAMGADVPQMAVWTRLTKVRGTPGRRKQRKPRPRES